MAALHSSCSSGEAQANNSWKVHAAGRVERITQRRVRGGKRARSRNRQASLPRRDFRRRILRQLAHRGLQFGPSFRGVDKLWRSERRVACANTNCRLDLEPELDHYEFHPALLDACLQAFDAALAEPGERPADDDTYLPFSLERLRLYKKPTAPCGAALSFMPEKAVATKPIAGDVNIFEADGSPVAELTGPHVQAGRRRALRGCVAKVLPFGSIKSPGSRCL